MKKQRKTRAPAFLLLTALLVSLCVLPTQAAAADPITGLVALREGKTVSLIQASSDSFTESADTGFKAAHLNYVAYTTPDTDITVRAEAAYDGNGITWQVKTVEAGASATDGTFAAATGVVASRWSSYTVTPEADKDTYVTATDSGGTMVYQVKIITAKPHVDVRFYNGVAKKNVAQGQVRLSDAKLLNMTVTIQNKGGDVSTGLSDNSGAAIYQYSTASGCTRVDVLTGQGYGASGPVGSVVTAPTAGAEKDGWTTYSAGGKDWFSYRSEQVELTGVSYDVAKGAVSVSLNAKGTDDGASAVDATGEAIDVFRFWYGLKEGQNGLDLEDIFQKSEEGDEFRVVAVDGFSSNVVYDSRLGAVTMSQVPDLVQLKLVKNLTNVTAGWGDENALVLRHAESDFIDATDKGETFTVDVAYYNLRTLSGKTVTIDALAGEDGNELKWQTAVTEPSTGIAGAAWSDLNATVANTTKSTVTVTPADGKDTYVKLADVLGNLYYIRLQPVNPEVNIRFYSTRLGERVSNGSVVVDQTDLKSVTFSLEAKGGAESSGLSDQNGDAILSFTGDAKYVDLVARKGYKADGSDAAVTGTYPMIGAAGDDGWATVADGDKVWFTFDAGKVDVTGLQYYLAEKTLVVTLTAKNGENLPGAVDATENEVELLRFWYGLKTGKTGWNLKDVFAAAAEGDDFRLTEVTNTGAENAIVDSRMGIVTMKNEAGLMKLVLIPRMGGTINVIVQDSATAYKKIHWDLFKIEASGDTFTLNPVLQSQPVVDAGVANTYAIPLLLEEAGDYRLVVSGDGYLNHVYLLEGVDPVVSDRLQAAETHQMQAGKVDTANAWAITLADKTACAGLFGKSQSDLPAGNAADRGMFQKCDFTEDDIIDTLDLGILMENLGSASSGSDTNLKDIKTAYDNLIKPASAPVNPTA